MNAFVILAVFALGADDYSDEQRAFLKTLEPHAMRVSIGGEEYVVPHRNNVPDETFRPNVSGVVAAHGETWTIPLPSPVLRSVSVDGRSFFLTQEQSEKLDDLGRYGPYPGKMYEFVGVLLCLSIITALFTLCDIRWNCKDIVGLVGGFVMFIGPFFGLLIMFLLDVGRPAFFVSWQTKLVITIALLVPIVAAGITQIVRPRERATPPTDQPIEQPAPT